MKGHQPFFLAAGIFALLAIGWWIGVLEAILPNPGPADPVRWHAHEMLFGYTAAVLAGFLLIGTAGWRLALLACLWIAARLAIAAGLPPAITAAIDLAFAPALALLRSPPLWAGMKWPTLGF